MNTTLKKANITDAELLHKMQIEAFMPLLQKYQDFDTSPGNESVESTLQRLEDPLTDYYFIMLDNDKVGGIRIKKLDVGMRYKISPLFILPKYQGLGIAQKTIRLVEEIYSPSKGWELCTILQEQGNCHLYEKMGYRQTGETKVINDKMTIVFYEK